MTWGREDDLSLTVKRASSTNMQLSASDRREVAAWIETNSAHLPAPVRIFLSLHQGYLATCGDLRKPFDSAFRELRRALGITPSSERRSSGSALAGMPRDEGAAKPGAVKSEREVLEESRTRSLRLEGWHGGLEERHGRKAKRMEEKLARLRPEDADAPPAQDDEEDIPVESIELTEEEEAASRARAERFIEHLTLNEGKVDPSLAPVNEQLMPNGAVLLLEDFVSLEVEVPADLSGATVARILRETRARYDFGVVATRVELDVEKKVLVDEGGERHVLSASTAEYGPPRFSVTWNALATLAVMAAQFAMPFNRLATLLSTAGKRFTAGALSRMLHYVAERLAPIYLELASQLADAEILAGDDTSCRVLEVSDYFRRAKVEPARNDRPPWADYQTPRAALESLRRCEEAKRARLQRRRDGDREAKRTPAETPSLAVLLGERLPFESPRRNGDGAKQSMNTTVVSGRSVAEEPTSLIVFYRSHLGGCGNLLEALLKRRNPEARRVILQGDLSSTNLIADAELLKRVTPTYLGCTAHARRPFANYEHEDPSACAHMLHLFLGLALHEERLNVHGRNRENVSAVRGHDSRRHWGSILALARKMALKWSPATKLGAGANYIIKNFDKLTAYLDDPRLEPTNNQRERMLRMEKLIEGSAMFRKSLEGRFVLDVVRTLLQTAVAAGVPVQEYLVSVLRAPPDDVAKHPARYTPRAWAAARLVESPPTGAAPTA